MFKADKRPLSKEEELLEAKNGKRIALATALFGVALLAGAAVVSRTPMIANEVIQEMAGIILSIKTLLCLYIGIDAFAFFHFHNRVRELSSDLGLNRKKPEPEEKEEPEAK